MQMAVLDKNGCFRKKMVVHDKNISHELSLQLSKNICSKQKWLFSIKMAVLNKNGCSQ